MKAREPGPGLLRMVILAVLTFVYILLIKQATTHGGEIHSTAPRPVQATQGQPLALRARTVTPATYRVPAAARRPQPAPPARRSTGTAGPRLNPQRAACTCPRCDALAAAFRETSAQHLAAIRELEARTHELRSQLAALRTEHGGLTSSAGEAVKLSAAAMQRVDGLDVRLGQWETALQVLDERLVAQEARLIHVQILDDVDQVIDSDTYAGTSADPLRLKLVPRR